PFQHGELGIVSTTGFTVAEHPAQFVTIPDAGSEQALERILRRGTQPAFARTGVDVAAEARREAVYARLGVTGRGKDRGFHFQHLAFGEERPHACIQLRPELQGRDRRRLVHAPAPCFCSNASSCPSSHTPTPSSVALSSLEPAS